MAVMCKGYCDRKYNREDMIVFKSKEYCESCYVKAKEESYELQALRNYILHVFKYRPSKMINNQIEKYHKDNGWSYKNIRLTLEYIVVIEGKQLEYKYGIGLVPHYYDDMIAYYKRKIKQAEDTQKAIKKSKHITVNKKEDHVHKFNKGRMIDLERIDDNDE